MKEVIQIETNRLLLVPISMKYKKDVFKEFNDQVTTYTQHPPAKNITETEKIISKMIEGKEKGTDLMMIILKKESNEFLGVTGAHNIRQEELLAGVWIKISAQGNGYGKEAVIGLKNWLDQNIEYDHIQWEVAKENIGSIKIAEALKGKINAKYSKTMKTGRTWDVYEYWIAKNNHMG